MMENLSLGMTSQCIRICLNQKAKLAYKNNHNLESGEKIIIIRQQLNQQATLSLLPRLEVILEVTILLNFPNFYPGRFFPLGIPSNIESIEPIIRSAAKPAKSASISHFRDQVSQLDLLQVCTQLLLQVCTQLLLHLLSFLCLCEKIEGNSIAWFSLS